MSESTTERQANLLVAEVLTVGGWIWEYHALLRKQLDERLEGVKVAEQALQLNPQFQKTASELNQQVRFLEQTVMAHFLEMEKMNERMAQLAERMKTLTAQLENE
jgi:hypothetical protein